MKCDFVGCWCFISNTGFIIREQRSLLEKCAATALSSKLIALQKDFFAKMVVDAVFLLDDLLQLKMIGIKKVQGGALEVCIAARRRSMQILGLDHFSNDPLCSGLPSGGWSRL